MKNNLILILLGILLVTSCNSKLKPYKIEGKQIAITDSLQSDASIEAFVKPYRAHINSSLDSVLAYAVDTYSKSDGDYNTAIGNMMADAVYEQANPVFKARTGHDIDFVLLNHGGIRAILSKGNVTTRSAYEIMPFENAIVVTKLKGAQVAELINYLITEKRAHPISRLKLAVDDNFVLRSAKINNEDFDSNKSYFVATNDYLYNGGDRMDFFKTNDSLYVLDYKVRNVLIDYFTKKDTIAPVIDDRFIQKKN